MSKWHRLGGFQMIPALISRLSQHSYFSILNLNYPLLAAGNLNKRQPDSAVFDPELRPKGARRRLNLACRQSGSGEL